MNILYITFSLVSFFTLNEPAKQEVILSTKEVRQEPKGLLLLKKHCYQCHNPNTASHDEILAPPLFGIKSHYKKAYPDRDQFIKSMEDFVSNPKEEKSLMKGPVKRFGVMPTPVVSSEDIQIIVEYIESNDLEKPAWYEQQHKKSAIQELPK